MKALLAACLIATAAIAATDERTLALARSQSARAEAERRVAQLAGQRDRNMAAAARTDQEALALGRRLGEAAAAVRVAEARARAAAAAERVQAARVAETRAPITGMIAALARIARRPPALALASGTSVTDAAHLSLLIRDLRERIAARSAALDEELERRSALRADTARAVATLRASQRLFRERRQLLAGARLDLAERAVMLSEATDVELERLRGLAEERSGLDEALGGARRDAERSARLAALPGPALAPDAPRGLPRSGPPLYALPAFGRVISGTGERDADGIRARGLTLATSPGLAVGAPGAGRVLYAGAFRNYGDIVIIDHGHGWTSLVAGLSRTSTELGADVLLGAPIGHAGRRLLLELRHEGQPVDIVGMAGIVRR